MTMERPMPVDRLKQNVYLFGDVAGSVSMITARSSLWYLEPPIDPHLAAMGAHPEYRK